MLQVAGDAGMTIVEDGAFQRAEAAIAEAGDNPALWPSALRAIADCTGDVGAIFVFPMADGAFGTLVTPGLEAAQRDFQSSEWRSRDLRYERAAERGLLDGSCVTDRHLVSEEEIETHPYYAELLRPHGLKYFAGLNVAVPGGGGAALSVQRAVDRPPFSDSELDSIARFGPLLGEALRRNAQQATALRPLAAAPRSPDVAALLRSLAAR
jgi:hypothetical protein